MQDRFSVTYSYSVVRKTHICSCHRDWSRASVTVHPSKWPRKDSIGQFETSSFPCSYVPLWSLTPPFWRDSRLWIIHWAPWLFWSGATLLHLCCRSIYTRTPGAANASPLSSSDGSWSCCQAHSMLLCILLTNAYYTNATMNWCIFDKRPDLQVSMWCFSSLL